MRRLLHARRDSVGLGSGDPRAVAAAMIIFVAACVPAPVEGWFVDLHGALIDEDGGPVVGAEGQFVTGEGAEVGTVSTDADGVWHLALYGTELSGTELTALFSGEGLADTRANFDVVLRDPVARPLPAGPWQSWPAEDRRVPTLRMATDVEVATLDGQVVDAVTGLAVEGLSLTLQQGWNARVGDPSMGQGVTDADGLFEYFLIDVQIVFFIKKVLYVRLAQKIRKRLPVDVSFISCKGRFLPMNK